MMNEIINVHGTQLPVVEFNGCRVVTLAMVDSVHQRPEDTAGRNFRANRERFVEGEDFFVASSDEIRRINTDAIPQALRRHDVTLLTEGGYLMLVKSFTDDLAWQVQRELVNSYFRKKEAASLTPAQMFLQSAQVMAEIERRQLEQAETVARIELRIDEVEQKTQVLPTCPTHAEPITKIRRRINEKYGLPSRIIDEVMRQSPYSPKPAGTVRNSREEADGATYEVFWIKDVNQIFKRFMSECEAVTSTQCVHPFIEGRFKVSLRDAA
jgi:hypothetical protein